MRRIILAAFAVAMLSIPTVAQAGTLGCLLGAAAGGLGGAQIGSGKGQLAAVGLGTLLGCGVGSSIQNSDQQRYQQPQQVYRPAPSYQTQRYAYYSQPRQYTGYVTPTYRQPALVQWQAPRQHVTQNSCPYSREYQGTVTVGGKQVAAYGKACSYDGGNTWDLSPLTPAR